MGELSGDNRTFYFKKLVRDKTVPGYMVDPTVVSVDWHPMSDQELKNELVLKLHEEANEVPIDGDKQDIAAEIGDILDVAYALARVCGVTLEAIEESRQSKEAKRGAFERGDYITSITVTPGSQWEEYCLADLERYPEKITTDERITGDNDKFDRVKAGEVYKHYKNQQLYAVLGVAHQTETGEGLVMYKPLYESEHEYFARPYDMFCGEVTYEGNIVKRFQKVSA